MADTVSRRDFLETVQRLTISGSLGMLAAGRVLGAAPKRPPNIIYILVDDLGYGDVNLDLPRIDEFKNPYIKTPNLAKLAKQSLVFRHHYASSPVCSPSRAGLLTGRTPTRCELTGAEIPADRAIDGASLAGQKAKPDKRRPHVAIREDDYVLLGYQTEMFKRPQEFELCDVVADPEQKTDLLAQQPERLQSMTAKLIAMYRDVNADRLRTQSIVHRGPS